MDINIILNDFEKLKSACEDMAGKKILVGLVGGVDSEVLKIASAHEYGTDKLPERSFIRASFDADQAQLREIVSGSVGKVLSGQMSADAAANAIGAQAAQLVQNFIDDNRVKPQSDFSKKTQHTTLYETGTHIRDRITYKIEEV
jgi:hypothetical protein|nr:MAG TPA: virion morphogenesis protein [Caudoviricetes sp.]